MTGKKPRLSVASFGADEPFSAQCSFQLDLFCTRRESFVALTDPASMDYVQLFIRNGRCNIKEAFQQSQMSGPACVAAVCGPPPLIRDVSEMAFAQGCDFHSEVFFF